MSQNREFNAATLEEAVAKASERLDIPESELLYETLDAGSPGFLGIGARDARIMVNAPDYREAGVEPENTSPEDESVPLEYDQQTGVQEYSEQDPIPPEEESSASATVPEELLAEIESFTKEAVEGMGFDARVDVYDADEFIAVDVLPGDPGLFIGQKGETIDALQHLLNISAYREREFVKRIVLDSEGYRQRRIEAVQGMAHRMARKAHREGRTIELPPMNSSERRVVHTYLKENPEVNTSSDGTGGNRRVNISPNQ
jgi:spoIIIJ-associated protein